MILAESGGDEYVDPSVSGAIGLMQVMPRDGLAAEFYCDGVPCFSERPAIEELEDPKFNVEYGSNYLATLVNVYGGDLREALYHYGPIDRGYSYADDVMSVINTVKE